jgi:3-hydroxybutyryl-CoA dehydrogenase
MTNRTVAIVGSGYMGGGIAQVLALSGATVHISDISEEIARTNYDRLIEEAKQFVADGLFPADAVERIRANVTPSASIEAAVADADFIEEAVPEKIEIKHATLKRISAAARPDAIIGSNTSTILIGSLATAVTGPERFLGVHFSNPAPFIPGVELIPHAATSEAAITVVEEIVAATGKETARVKDSTGFSMRSSTRQPRSSKRASPAQRTSTPSFAQRSAFAFRCSARLRSPTWPAWMCTRSATRPFRRGGRSVSPHRVL